MMEAGSRILTVKCRNANSCVTNRAATQASTTVHQRAKKIATPPRRGILCVWMWRSELGPEFQPRAFEKSRTQRVSTTAAKRAPTKTRSCITLSSLLYLAKFGFGRSDASTTLQGRLRRGVLGGDNFFRRALL